MLLCLCAILVHGLSLRADFYVDDRPYILANDQVQEAADLPSGFASLQLTFGLWRAIHVTVGDQSLAYHTSNLLFHALNAALFYFVARRFLAVSHSSNLN